MTRTHCKKTRYSSILSALFFLAALHSFGGAAAVTTSGDSGLRWTAGAGRHTIEEIESGGGVYRSVRVFGAGRTEEAGRPDLPVYGYWIAVPEGHTARARVVDAGFTDFAGPPVEPTPRDTLIGGDALLLFTIDRPFYASAAWYPEPLVAVGEPARLRNQRLVPVRVFPFRFQPSTGLLRVYDRIEVEVEFVPDPSKGGAAWMEPAVDEGRWEDVYRGAILNYDQGRSFRRRPARPLRPAAKQLRTADEYKIAVKESGLHRIDFSELKKAGLAAGTPVASLALYRRGYSDELFRAGEDPFTEVSIPFHARDAAGDGLFGEGDALFVYLPGFREDRMRKDTDDRFAYQAIYFLSVEGTREPIETRETLRGWTGLEPLASFPDSIRWEVDEFYNIGSPSDTADLYFPKSYETWSQMTEIVLPRPDPSIPYGIKAMTVSIDAPGQELYPYDRYILINQADGDTAFRGVVSGVKPYLFPAERTHPAASLAAGANRFLYQGTRGATPEGNDVQTARGFLDWYEIHANFLYRAEGDYLLFSSGEAGGRFRIEAGGFTGSDLLLFDVSDPYRSVRILAEPAPAEGGGYAIVFQDSAGAPKRYAASSADRAKRITASSITADAPTDRASEEGDFLILAFDAFADEMEPLAAHRRAKGVTTRIVPVNDVYDEFNGGVKDTTAIARWIRFAFQRWASPPLALLLVGDGYEDYKGIARNAQAGDFDFIPACPVYQRVVDPTVTGDHWDASDIAYVLLDGPEDPLPDLLIGRFPVGTEGEASLLVEKTIDYEAFRPEDAWRSRAVFLADDAWVVRGEGFQNVFQVQFERNSAEFSREIKETAAKGIDTVNIFVSRFTDVIHPLCPFEGDSAASNKADIDCTIELCRQVVTGALFREINGAGVGLVNFQGHGNRNVLTHEVILRNGPSYRPFYNNTSQDIRQKSNHQGRPYIFMGYGCSISEFDRLLSLGYESLPEEMMISDRGGAVATFGSTGTEELLRNLDLNDSILKYFFQTPGVVPGADPEALPPWYAGYPRWTLGEMIALGLMDFASVPSSERLKVIRRNVLFGDPLLAIDARPPHFEATVDGVPVEDGGALLGRADGGPVEIVVRVHDEVRIDRAAIAVLEADEPVDTTLYSVAPDDSLPDDGRSWKIVYRPEIRFGEYTIVFRAVDGAGREGDLHASSVRERGDHLRRGGDPRGGLCLPRAPDPRRDHHPRSGRRGGDPLRAGWGVDGAGHAPTARFVPLARDVPAPALVRRAHSPRRDSRAGKNDPLPGRGALPRRRSSQPPEPDRGGHRLLLPSHRLRGRGARRGLHADREEDPGDRGALRTGGVQREPGCLGRDRSGRGPGRERGLSLPSRGEPLGPARGSGGQSGREPIVDPYLIPFSECAGRQIPRLPAPAYRSLRVGTRPRFPVA
ncbi:MAG: C25 family cysteine peptidase [Candidatus Eisenbacteria bacterium]